MPDSGEQGKQCPDCGQTLRPDVGICRHCGYVFPSGKAARAGPLGLTRELAAQTATGDRVSTWVKLLWPIVAVVGVVVLTFTVFHGFQRTDTWEQAQRELRMPKSYDSDFEAFVVAAYRQDGMTAEVRASDGICLINVAQDMSGGIMNKLGAKLGALAIGATYAALRQKHGDDPVATVTIFTNGRRYASATCDGHQHPEFLK
ncbi:MAG TPA: zinc ribbon domain-containing protein [Verrucomicrobiae bacterium]|nr:zinc ribbon domain-containing protein [Verrucomicrobiae bacterium]